MKIRVRERARFQADKLSKIALATTPRLQLDLYCVAPGQSQTPHSHSGQDKVYFVLEGCGRFAVGNEVEHLTAGEAIVAPAGVEHGLVNDGADPLTVLVVVSPPPAH